MTMFGTSEQEQCAAVMVQAKPIRILSVENYPVFRLATIIGSQEDMLLVAHASNAAEAVAEFRRHRPDVTLMDLRLPDTNSTDVLIAIRAEFPRARIIMLPTLDSEGDILRALRAGASAYILNSIPKNELLRVIRLVHAATDIFRPTWRLVSPSIWVTTTLRRGSWRLLELFEMVIATSKLRITCRSPNHG